MKLIFFIILFSVTSFAGKEPRNNDSNSLINNDKMVLVSCEPTAVNNAFLRIVTVSKTGAIEKISLGQFPETSHNRETCSEAKESLILQIRTLKEIQHNKG